MKKAITGFLLTAVVFLTGCENKGYNAPDISDITKFDLSYKISTDIPCVKADEIYDVEKYEIDWEREYDAGAPSAFDGERFYYTNPLAPKDQPMIVSFNPATKEEKGLFYPELDENQSCFSPKFAALHNSHFFFFANVFASVMSEWKEEYYFYDIDLSDGNVTSIKIDKLPGRTEALAAQDNFIYFGDSYEEGENSDKVYIIKKYDINDKSFSTFKINAKIPSAYKNGILYYHDGGLYYDGDEVIESADVIYNGDSMVLAVDEYFMRHYVYKEKIFYRYYSYDNTDYRTFGYFDDNFQRHDLAESKVSKEESEFSYDFVFAENADLMSFSLFGSYDEKPIIYDIKNNLFAAINVENTHDHFYAFSDNDSIILYLRGYFTDIYNGDEYINATYYRISRKVDNPDQK